MLVQVLGGAAEDVAERPLVVLGERGDRGRRLAHQVVDARADLAAGRGEREHLHATVAAGAPPLDQAAGLEPVRDPGHVRRVADEELGERAHRQRLLGIEQAEGVRLRERQPELAEGGADPGPLHHPDLEEELLGFAGDASSTWIILDYLDTCLVQVSR